jgi:putative NADPH-quinone reductase
MGENGKKLAEAHADFIKRWYQEVFEHGYKHGYVDGRRDETGRPHPTEGEKR